MKKSFAFIMTCFCAVVSAQNMDDVLRTSAENIQGTARYQAMGGAFGALGGDLSALNTNPAGAAVFTHNLISISGTNYKTINDATYFNEFNHTRENTSNFNQIGGVMVFTNKDDSPWRKLTLAANYDITNNFENQYYVSGQGTDGIDSYFKDLADGISYGAIYWDFNNPDNEYVEDVYQSIGEYSFIEQQAFLGIAGGIIEPENFTDENKDYVSNATYTTAQQFLRRETTGYNSKFAANIATQYKNSIYLGASINIHSLYYSRLDRLKEGGYEAGSFNSFTNFDNYLKSSGGGFSFNLGAIARVTKFLRLGASYQSPTWYRITDELSQQIDSDLADTNINYINLNDIVTVYEPYKIKTPAKLTGSAAFIFGKQGLLSIDYGIQDMSQAKLSPANDFTSVNEDISSNLGTISDVKIGAEYRIKKFSLRGGYKYAQSPYADGNTIGDLTGYSGGLGYDFGGSKLDLALNTASRQVEEKLLTDGIITPATINRVYTNATLTYTMKF